MSAHALSLDLKHNCLGLECAELKTWFATMGEAPFRATQVYQWIHQQGVADFAQMSNIAKNLRQFLVDNATVEQFKISEEQCSSDGTIKWLLELADGNKIETVYIPETNRATLCVSSQVGCKLTCQFCSTATQGFSRDLTSAEIVGQLWFARHRIKTFNGRAITNVVFMGMGEPMLNLANVVPALKIMRDDLAYGLSKRRVTVSTSGLVPQIYQLKEQVDVALAISLHASCDALRNQLVPINRKYPLSELLTAVKDYAGGARHRRITMEYVMLQDVNDSLEQARQLARILRDVPVKINLIPFNPFRGTQFVCSKPPQIKVFQDYLMQAGYVTTVRKTRGQDILAACGQLKGQVQDRTQRQARFIRQIESTHIGQE